MTLSTPQMARFKKIKLTALYFLFLVRNILTGVLVEGDFAAAATKINPFSLVFGTKGAAFDFKGLTGNWASCFGSLGLR